MDVSDITATDLQDDILGPIYNKEYRKQVTKRMKDDKYMLILPGYIKSVFQDFESYLRKDNIKLVLDDYNSGFFTYDLDPGIHTFQDFSEVPLKCLQPKYDRYRIAIDIEYDDIAMKNKMDIRAGIIATRFDEQSFFTILGFNPHRV